MLIGVFADSHDHLDNLRLAVDLFNATGCERAIFAGDLVSTFAVPCLRKLRCPLIGCFGDNEGNKPGLDAGLSILGRFAEPPFGYVAPDGSRFLVAHMLRQLQGFDDDDFHIAVYAHSHRPKVHYDERGRLYVNPGETGGWKFREPTVAIVDTRERSARIVPLTSL
jgi:putative phosphoesterase